MRKAIFILLVLTMLLLTGCGNYSEGDRVGQITKFSKRGLIWKTWEGELNLGGMRASADGVVANVFKFSLDSNNKYKVDQEQIILDIQYCMDTGVRCKLMYQQEIVIAPWRADHDYIITNVEILDGPKHTQKGNYVDVEGGTFTATVEN